MNKIDARKQSREDLHKRHQQVIRHYLDNMPVMKIVEVSGLSWPAVNATIKKFKAGGETALKPEKRGRKQGTGRILSEEQESELRELICNKRPYQLKIRLSSQNSRLFLWNREAVMQLIEKKFGIKLSERCLAKYLERWGFLKVKHNQRPYKSCSKDIKKWLDENYANIEQRAQVQRAEIYWTSRAAVTNPVRKQTDQETTRRLAMVSAINNQGKVHWLIIKGQFTTDRQIKFLNGLANNSNRRIFLIRDNLKYFDKMEVLDWMRRKKRNIEIFPPLSRVLYF